MSEDLFSAPCPTCGIEPCACAQIDVGGETEDYLEPPVPEAEIQVTVPVGSLDGLREVVTSGALAAFEARRIDQLLKHGHTPARDRELALDYLPRQALVRVKDALDYLAGKGGDLDPALVKIEIAGACLAAAWDVVMAAKREQGNG